MSYEPGRISGDTLEELRRTVEQELFQISSVLTVLSEGRFAPQFVEPQKRELGMLAFADGTDWDPGSGQGYYFWNGTAWSIITTGFTAEEGQGTVSPAFGGAFVGGSVSQQAIQWLNLNNQLLFYHWRLTITNRGSSTGAFTLTFSTDLPQPSPNNGDHSAAVLHFNMAAGLATPPTFAVLPGTRTHRVYAGAGANAIQLTDADFGIAGSGGQQLMASGHYFI